MGNTEELDLVLFLDANMPNIQDCRSSRCLADGRIFCKHRFHFEFKWFREEGLIHSVRLFDHQVILYCLGLMRKFSWVKNLAQKGRFVLITKDHNFLRDAQTEWKKRTHYNTSPKLDFGKDRVTIGKLSIIIKTVLCPKEDPGGQEDFLRIIAELNFLFGKK